MGSVQTWSPMFLLTCKRDGELYKLSLRQSRDTFQGYKPPPAYVDPDDPSTWKVAGPLMTSAIALFGNGSWLSTAVDYESTKPHNSSDHGKLAWQLMCRGMPFSNLWVPGRDSFPDSVPRDFVSMCGWDQQSLFGGYQADEDELLRLTHQFLGAFAPTDITSGTRFHQSNNNSKSRSLNNTESLLNVALFVANRAILTLVSPEVDSASYDLTGRKIYSSPGVKVQRPVLPKATLIVLSVLLGLQLLGLGYLTYYLYRFPTWTGQLDAMATARIGARLEHRGVLPAIGPVRKRDRAVLETVGGLVGIVEKSPRRESSISSFLSPNMGVTDGSEVELHRLTSNEVGCKNDEDSSTDIELGLDGSGPILTTNTPRRSPYVLGLKRAYTATFISRQWRTATKK
jgi:hypothetical protein